MKEHRCNTFESCFYIGSRRKYTGSSFTKQELIKAIHEHQEADPESLPVRVSDCCYVAHDGYCEEGWEVSAIEYPNNHKMPYEVHAFSLRLARHLLNYFAQNRITVIPSDPSMQTIMLEADEPESRANK